MSIVQQQFSVKAGLRFSESVYLESKEKRSAMFRRNPIILSITFSFLYSALSTLNPISFSLEFYVFFLLSGARTGESEKV